jgi:hypothetical protein
MCAESSGTSGESSPGHPRLALLCVAAAAGSDPDSTEFAGGLVQRTLLEVSHAADDLVQIFGLAQREPASLFAVWAGREVGWSVG